MSIEQLQQQINELNGVVAGLRADQGVIQQQLCEQSAQLPQAIKAAIADELRPGGVLYRAKCGGDKPRG
ncbi:hypothetical protein [Chromobacterium violaceum]|uniref:hypothetical protein n=1 Tax=Chromobacterium violaceum TaxID=536 RepID=UPI0009DAD237|nr:hypothetical protein [Chromobacterium violaceum]MBX9267230.1 hypothetical protein [Chromobacterium violaceum]OQS10089.1 hypothetical protein B0T38_11000 [Chromobacterium violaceum]OQS26504.1 hypothetical protein B0T37_10605 [Chromobacterium violaceum]QRO33991.1 hypothetical protein I6K04_04405 [Chromobacterium violaceum]QRQ16206.1 hypothetical protein I6K03_18325 [Chromobacterium violaceum]